MLKKILLILIVLSIWLIPYHTVSSQSPTSVLNQATVHSQGNIITDFFAWLGNLLFHDQIPQKVCNVKERFLPGNADPNGNCDSSGSVSVQAVSQSGSAAEALMQSSNEYTKVAYKNTPNNPQENNQSFFDKLLTDLNFAFPIGNENAKKFVAGSLPPGEAEKILPTPGDENSAMAFALDCKKDSTLPPGANPDSKCLPTNQPVYVSPTPTPTETPIPTPTTAYNPTGPDLVGYLIPTPANQYPYYDQFPFHIPYNKKADLPATVDTINSGLLTHIDLAIGAAKSKWPTSMLDHWKEVYDAAVAEGWNGAFVLSIWIEETGASDACTIGYPIIDFGVGATFTSCNDPLKYQKFQDQLHGFLNLYGFYEHTYLRQSPVTFEMFLCAYADGHYPCNFAAHPGFVYRLPRVYNCLLYPTKDNCRAALGYFNLTLLPDTLAPPSPSGPPVNVTGLDKMKNMVTDLQNACTGGIVSFSNIACIDQTANPIPQNIKYIMYNSAKSYTYFQCVGFVQASEFLINGVPLGGGGKCAINYATNVPPGYRYVPKSGVEAIKPGDILLWDIRSFAVCGHVARVYAVYSNYSVKVCEANWYPEGYVDCSRPIALNNAQIVGWLTPK